jgi:hypothetical protein
MWLLIGTALMLAALSPKLSHAEVARVELRPFQSTTLSDQEFLTGKKEGKPVILAGELRIPKLGTDRYPPSCWFTDRVAFRVLWTTGLNGSMQWGLRPLYSTASQHEVL